MRSIRLLAATTVILVGAVGCGDNNDPDNQSPTASFSQVCTGLSCVFTDTSTDPDGSIASRSWTFASGTPASSTTSPQTVTFPAAGTFAVSLTVTDNEGATGNVSQNVTVTGGTTNNVPPTASFNLPATCVAGTPCGFTSTSTDLDDDIATATYAWTFGDNGVGTGANATHTYEDPGTYTVTLTVTDVRGAVSTPPASQQLTVTAPTPTDCTTSDARVDCILTIGIRSTLTFTVVSRSCELSGNTLRITAPFLQTVFFNLCARTPGETYTIQVSGGGANQVFEAGSQVTVQFVQGPPDAGDPTPGDPGIRIEGGSPSWTLKIDDGGAPNAPGEPDFNDAEVSVQANAAP
jgi:PKD repeat protein